MYKHTYQVFYKWYLVFFKVICSDFGAPKNEVSHCFHCFPFYLPWSNGTGQLEQQLELDTEQQTGSK